MKYTVVTTERAANEIVEAVAWWSRERSVEQAERWYEGIREAIAGLEARPDRFPMAAEQKLFSYELRELHFGLGSKSTHRAVFTVVGEAVLVLTVRHVSRGALGPEDLSAGCEPPSG